MYICKLVFKVLRLPIILLIQLVRLTALAAIVCGSYVLSLIMLLLLGCTVYTVIQQAWSQTFLLFLLELSCGVLFCSAVFIAGFAQDLILFLNKSL